MWNVELRGFYLIIKAHFKPLFISKRTSRQESTCLALPFWSNVVNLRNHWVSCPRFSGARVSCGDLCAAEAPTELRVAGGNLCAKRRSNDRAGRRDPGRRDRKWQPQADERGITRSVAARTGRRDEPCVARFENEATLRFPRGKCRAVPPPVCARRTPCAKRPGTRTLKSNLFYAE